MLNYEVITSHLLKINLNCQFNSDQYMDNGTKFYHSEENELIQRPPKWITQWGMTAVTIIFLGLGVGTYFYSYPDIIVGEFVLEKTIQNSASFRTLEDVEVPKQPDGIGIQAVNSFLPDNRFVVHADVPSIDFVKIEKGQKANLKFVDYPFPKFGIVSGIVVHVSSDKANKYCRVQITLDRGYVTSKKNALELHEEMRGTVEIVSRKKKLFYRILEPIFNISQ